MTYQIPSASSLSPPPCPISINVSLSTRQPKAPRIEMSKQQYKSSPRHRIKCRASPLISMHRGDEAATLNECCARRHVGGRAYAIAHRLNQRPLAEAAAGKTACSPRWLKKRENAIINSRPAGQPGVIRVALVMRIWPCHRQSSSARNHRRVTIRWLSPLLSVDKHQRRISRPSSSNSSSIEAEAMAAVISKT